MGVCTFEINIRWTVLSFDRFKCLNRQGYMHQLGLNNVWPDFKLVANLPTKYVSVNATINVYLLWLDSTLKVGTGFAESLQHCIGHQSSAPSVYGRLTAQNLPYKEDIELWVLNSVAKVLQYPVPSLFRISPSTVSLVSFSDCLGRVWEWNYYET